MSVKIVIAEDQGMVLGALAALLAIEHDFEVIGQARNGREALQLTLQHKPDVLLTDIEMPEM
ncbi:MAG TPA: response regulator, partial [Candidatus Sulfotelmatobacter sp.]|nr:response regulator [Candidatus Sulfotelmatobacter sp.]